MSAHGDQPFSALRIITISHLTKSYLPERPVKYIQECLKQPWRPYGLEDAIWDVQEPARLHRRNVRHCVFSLTELTGLGGVGVMRGGGGGGGCN